MTAHVQVEKRDPAEPAGIEQAAVDVAEFE